MSKFTDKKSMTCVDVTVREWTRQLEDTEVRRSGRSRAEARERIAARTGLALGTLENIRRGRGKGLRRWIEDKIAWAVIKDAEAEIGRLNRVLEMARQRVEGGSSDEIREAEASIQAARKAIGKIGR